MTQEQYSLIIGEMFLVVTHDNILNALKNAIPEKEDDIQDLSEKMDVLSKYVEGKIREYAIKKVLDLIEQEKKNEHIHKHT
nr:MAG TPA: Prefoldin [Caudoviricetes sp.]